MNQPIIDPEKVNSWTESMRGAFGGSDLGMWLVIGLTLGFLLFVTFTAWSVNREAKRQAATPVKVPARDAHAGHGARIQPQHDQLVRAQRRRANFTPR